MAQSDTPKEMNAPGGGEQDRQVDLAISAILRIGVITSSAVTLLGLSIYLLHNSSNHPDYQNFHGQPASLTNIQGIVQSAMHGNGDGIMQLGVALLLFTPIVRVAFSIFAFLKQNDRVYVVVSGIVFAVLMFSLFGGKNVGE